MIKPEEVDHFRPVSWPARDVIGCLWCDERRLGVRWLGWDGCGLMEKEVD